MTISNLLKDIHANPGPWAQDLAGGALFLLAAILIYALGCAL